MTTTNSLNYTFIINGTTTNIFWIFTHRTINNNIATNIQIQTIMDTSLNVATNINKIIVKFITVSFIISSRSYGSTPAFTSIEIVFTSRFYNICISLICFQINVSYTFNITRNRDNISLTHAIIDIWTGTNRDKSFIVSICHNIIYQTRSNAISLCTSIKIDVIGTFYVGITTNINLITSV